MGDHPFQRIVAEYARGHRQKHECTCGPSSLALATSSLGLRALPEEMWHSETLKKWMPVDQFLVRGMALHEAAFVTEFLFGSDIEVRLTRAFKENYSQFTEDLKRAAESIDQAIVINFAQDHLLNRPFQGQGEPHYSIIAGFDLPLREVTIADVDVDLKEPYRRSIDQVFESMTWINPAFSVPRGWLTLKRRATK